MFRNKRFACLFLGLWLGAAVSVDLLVTENFSAAERFVPAPGSIAVASQIRQAGQKSIRFIMRRNAAEENGEISEIWEWAQIGIATFFLCMIVFGDRPPVVALVMVPAMLVIVLLQRFVLTPHIVSLGREVDEIPARAMAGNPIIAQFWGFQGVYLGSEIVKLVLGIGVGARLMIRRTPDHPQRDREFDREAIPARESAAHSNFDRRTRKRRKTDPDG